MKKVIKILIFLVFVIGKSSLAQKSINNLTGNDFSIARIVLSDGSKLFGIIVIENDSVIILNDFTADTLTVKKQFVQSSSIIDAGNYLFVEANNEASYYGKIIAISNDSILLKSDILGLIKIKTTDIKNILPVGTPVSDKESVWFENPNATRYLFAPSAIPLKKKEGYYQNAYLLVNSVNVGITNNLTVGGGVVIPFLFYVTPKLSYKVAKNVYAGGGILFTQSFLTGLNLSAGIGYGLLTIGNNEYNFTIGSGYGFAKNNTDYKETPMPIITLNGMTRIAKKLSLVTENWLIPRRGYNIDVPAISPEGFEYEERVFKNNVFYSLAASLGLRFMLSAKTSVDFSIVGIYSDPNTNFLALPYLDFVYKFY
jgi:hypothetical protein